MRTRATVIALSLLIALGSGCGTAPKKTAPEIGVDTPAEWTGAVTPAGAVHAGWWSDFGSAALDSLVTTAALRNHDLKAAEARLAAAAAEARIAGADVWPTLDVSYGASRSKRNFVGFPIPGGENEVLTVTKNSPPFSTDQEPCRATPSSSLWPTVSSPSAFAPGCPSLSSSTSEPSQTAGTPPCESGSGVPVRS